MYRFVRAGLAVIVGVVATMGLLGFGVAWGSGSYEGKTYAKAAERLQSMGITPVIATIIGSQLPTDDCVVVNSYRPITRNSSGRVAHKATVMLDLNCNNNVAAPGKPGNSVMTPQGKLGKKIQVQADKLNSNTADALAKGKTPACGKNAASAQSCSDFCNRYSMCSKELVNYLAGLV
ncbi:hypothetical protein [Mycobacterium sp. shizuoka-1]|uniref:hypothetical protein n=1 Tax=Mycobacterium sp. shizuoka-1 TaxID=2039281 RepID=UPI000C05DB8D|nr:hypothetical protein [Mycobacterium sp. shizuoka-1]GAY14333.1 hypothetical protein MSZK_10590 [Mycobacterium sp. shizuoka-1]